MNILLIRWLFVARPMPVQPKARPYEELAQKWSKLAERRRAHFIELYKSGRWKHYYSEAEFLARLREAARVSDEWAKLAADCPEAKTAS
jgi:uncharacterized repeat protein (TIGR03809 family)